MATHITTIPGLPGGPLQTSFVLHAAMLSASATRQRPGLKLRGEFETTQHMTANWNTKATAEKNYLLGGSGGRQASWHFTVDDTMAYFHLPVDEVGWHAGDGSGRGNMGTVACELTQQRAMVNDAVKWRRARSNAAEILAKIAARKNAPPPGVFHNKWSGKDCPAVIRANATWTREYHEDYTKFYNMERAAMPGSEVPDEKIEHGDTIKALANLNLRQRATISAPIITTLVAGAEMTVNGLSSSADGYVWLPVMTSPGQGFVAMGDSSGPFIEKIRDAPEPESYVDAVPIPALLDTDLSKYDTAEGITTDDTGNEFIFVADVIVFDKETIAGQYAEANARPVKAPYKIGERAIAAWLVKNNDDAWFYVLAGEGDEWIRVPYTNTRRVSDAPLLGDDTP